MKKVTVINKIRSAFGRIMQYAELPLRLAVKFFGFLFLFRFIMGADMFASLEGAGQLLSTGILMALALMAMLLPNRCGVFMALLLVVYSVFQTSLLGAALVGMGLMVLYISAASLFPDEVFLIVLVPLCIHYHWLLAVPLVAGMYMGGITVVPVCIGVLVYGFYQVIPLFLNLKMDGSLDEIPTMIAEASENGINQLMDNNSLGYMMIIFSGIILATVIVRKLHVNYSRYIALGVGSVFGLISLLIGANRGNIAGESIAWNSILVILALALLELFKVPLSYNSAQRLEFEDDEYVYKVRLIPKMSDFQEREAKKTVRQVTRQNVRATSLAEAAQDKLRARMLKDQGFKNQAVVVPPVTAPSAAYQRPAPPTVSPNVDLSLAPNDVNEYSQEARTIYETKVAETQGKAADLSGNTMLAEDIFPEPKLEEGDELLSRDDYLEETGNAGSQAAINGGTVAYTASAAATQAVTTPSTQTGTTERSAHSVRSVLADDDEPMELFQDSKI